MELFTGIYCLIMFTFIHAQDHNPHDESDDVEWENKDFYSFSVKDIHGDDVSLEKYRGKISLVVNVASECGYTDGHYQALVKLQDQLGPSGKFNVLAFPCNQFGQQEPKSDKEVFHFATEKYNVNFPMFSKIQVMGQKVPLAWTYLLEHNNGAPNWNFWKYLVDEAGHLLVAWGPWVSVEEVRPRIEEEVHRIEAELELMVKHSEL